MSGSIRKNCDGERENNKQKGTMVMIQGSLRVFPEARESGVKTFSTIRQLRCVYEGGSDKE